MEITLKYLGVSAAAALTTVICFLLMQFLIQHSLEQAPELDIVRFSAPIMEQAPEIMQDVRQRPTRLVPAELPPDPEGIPISPEDVRVTVKALRPTPGSVAELVDTARQDFQPFPPIQDLMPIYVVQPVYPFSAVMKEIEGFVLINFSVRANGTVVNPVVVDSAPGRLFDDAALSAVAKFKFQPRTIGGDTMSVQDVQMRFVFRLDAASGSGKTRVETQLINTTPGSGG
ncbi:MAG: energy transducer TonB [Pseudomonadota bacterium]